MRSFGLALMLGCLVVAMPLGQNSFAQTRDEKVRSDRDALKDDETWHYDDLDAGIAAAKRESKPLMVVLRCIP